MAVYRAVEKIQKANKHIYNQPYGFLALSPRDGIKCAFLLTEIVFMVFVCSNNLLSCTRVA